MSNLLVCFEIPEQRHSSDRVLPESVSVVVGGCSLF